MVKNKEYIEPPYADPWDFKRDDEYIEPPYADPWDFKRY